MNDFFRDKQGNPLYLVGLQAHNSSTGTDMLDKAIRAVQLYGGNVLETPIYWNAIEPEMGKYDMSLVQDTIDRARAAGLYLILLWFATSKNGHPNYAPEYIKLDPATYRIAHGADGAPLPALSPHCEATLERDALAFETVMAFLKAYDGDVGTVLAVQIENEMGLGGTDRDYSEIACADYAKPLPEALLDVELADCGARDGSRTWRGHFGRHAHEAFCAWYHARTRRAFFCQKALTAASTSGTSCKNSNIFCLKAVFSTFPSKNSAPAPKIAGACRHTRG